jgi:hypothetical protein
MGTDLLPIMAKDPTLYPSFSAAIATSMSAELDQLYDHVLWNGTGSLRELFTSEQSFVDLPLAAVYGVARDPVAQPPPVFRGLLAPPIAASAVAGGALEAVNLDPAIRSGILTRAGFLTVHSDSDSSGPIARGVFLLRSILCLPPLAPPANVPPAPQPSDPSVQGKTTRQRFEKHVSDTRCAGCHQQIDGLGFGFEEFDGMGAYRQVENGQAIDSTGVIVGSGELDGPFEGAVELSTRLSGSQLLAKCFAKQAYRYAMGQVEDPDDDIAWLKTASSPDANMTHVLLTVIENPLFTTRTVE